MLIRIALLLISIPLLAHGGEGLYVAARSRAQASMTCEEYFRQRPRSGWIRLTGCEVDYVRAGYREARGRITEMLFPLRPAGSTPALPAVVVLATRDRGVLAIAERTIGGGSQSDQESFLVMMLQIVTAMRVAREVDGVVRPPLETLRTRRSLEAIRAPLDDHFVIVDLHARPRLLLPALETAAAAAALLVFLVLTKRARSRAAEPAREDETDIDAVETAAAVPDPVLPPGSLRGLMLLNLTPTSTIADIETAPPLGTRAQVRDQLASWLPGISFDGSGHGTFSRPDVTVALDLGKLDIVHTAVVDLEGEGAGRTLQRLLSQSGWRAFSPRRGMFL